MKGGLLATLAAALLVLLDPGGWLAAFELRTVDARHRGHAGPSASTERIVILEIGEGTLAQLAPIYGRWPWPRSVHAEVVDYLAQDGAVAIGFDLLLAERADRRVVDARAVDTLAALAAAADVPEVRAELGAQIEALRPQRGDAELAAAAAVAGNVFAAAVLAGAPAAPGDAAQGGDWPGPGVPLAAPNPDALHAHALLPYAELAQAARALGHINVLPDADGVYRRFAPLAWWRDAERALPALGVAIAAHVRGVPLADLRRSDGALKIGDLALPLLADGSALIPYRGDAMYRRIPYEQVLASKDLRAAGKPAPLAPGSFDGRIVLISALAAGIADLRATPFSPVTPGILLHANVIDGLLAGRTLRATGAVGAALMVLGACLLAVAATARLRPAAGLALLLALAGAHALVCWNAYAQGWMLPLVPPVAGLALAWGGGLLLRVLASERERRWLRDAFGHYLAPTVLEQLLRAPAGLRLGGERREMSVLFSDIAGFTGMSERLPPEAVGRLLNAYLERMTACVLETLGTLDKFVGDAVMAEWNAPLAQPDHAARACECALRMLAEVDRADAPWRADAADLDIRIGINSGEMLVGNMGSPQVFDYTVLGNEVNTAARLEPLNKACGTRILVSEATRRGAEQARPGHYAFRALGRVRLKGRAQPLAIHQLLGRQADLNTSTRARLARHAQALKDFHERRFAAALAHWHELLLQHPDDGPAAHCAERCAAALAEPPPADWDGAYEQTEK